MAHQLTMPFDPQTFLALVGSGKTILKVKKNQVFLSQAEFNTASRSRNSSISSGSTSPLQSGPFGRVRDAAQRLSRRRRRSVTVPAASGN